MDMPISPSQTASNQVIGKGEIILPVLQFIDEIDINEGSRHSSFFLFLNWNGNIKKNVIEHGDSSCIWTGNKEVLLQGFFVCFGNFNFVSVPQL